MNGVERPRDDGERLILGFDGGCFSCSDLAQRIEERAGDRLEVRSLRDPQLERWRRECLGEGAPWTPTLFRAEGKEVRAWTGWRLAVRLGRALGFARTYSVLQMLGEVGTSPRVLGASVDRAVSSIPRSQFLKAVGGGAVALSILAGVGPLAGAARAGSWVHPFDRVRFLSKKSLRGAAKQRAVEAALASQDVSNVWSEQPPTSAQVSAVRHALEGDNALTAVSWVASGNRIVVHYVADRAIGNYLSQAMLVEVLPGKEFSTTAESINGTKRSENAPTSDRGPSGSVEVRSCGCRRWRWSCLAHVAATTCLMCAGTCAGCVATPAKWACVSCASCLLAACPLATRSCCRRW